MIYQDLYWNAALAYGAAALGFAVVVWKVGTKLPWRPLGWWLMWLYLCVIFTPWQGTDPEVYYAPVIIVAAFDFLDVGIAPTLALLQPMFAALIVGTLVIVIAAIVARVRQLRNPQDQKRIEPTNREESAITD